jgi:hypothetical protein
MVLRFDRPVLLDRSNGPPLPVGFADAPEAPLASFDPRQMDVIPCPVTWMGETILQRLARLQRQVATAKRGLA